MPFSSQTDPGRNHHETEQSLQELSIRLQGQARSKEHTGDAPGSHDRNYAPVDETATVMEAARG